MGINLLSRNHPDPSPRTIFQGGVGPCLRAEEYGLCRQSLGLAPKVSQAPPSLCPHLAPPAQEAGKSSSVRAEEHCHVLRAWGSRQISFNSEPSTAEETAIQKAVSAAARVS